MGLAHLVHDAMIRLTIANLTDTYLTISLEDIAKTTQLQGPDQAREYIGRMVSFHYFY